MDFDESAGILITGSKDRSIKVSNINPVLEITREMDFRRGWKIWRRGD